jgi:uncharacterized protein YkwD/uncharacterized protein YukE
MLDKRNMKKIIFLIILIFSIGAAQKYWPQIKSLVGKSPQLLQVVQNNPAVEALKQDVINGGALRGTENAPDAYLTRAGTINITNQMRRQNGNLSALTENTLLDQDAQKKLQDMFARQYFEHVSPSGLGPADQAKAIGYQYAIIGENLALGNFKNDASLLDAWMNSPGHRANILNAKYQDIGVAVGKGVFEGKTTWLAVQEFGRPLSSCPLVDPNLKSQINSLKNDVDAITPQLQTLKSQLNATPDPQNQSQVDAYNQLVAQYNALVKDYNNKVDMLKTVTNSYNNLVQLFNACAS